MDGCARFAVDHLLCLYVVYYSAYDPVVGEGTGGAGKG